MYIRAFALIHFWKKLQVLWKNIKNVRLLFKSDYSTILSSQHNYLLWYSFIDWLKWNYTDLISMF